MTSPMDPIPTSTSTPASAPTGAAAAAAATQPSLERWRLAPNGRVRDLFATDAHRVVSAAMHLWPFFIAVVGPFAVLVPLLLWLAFRKSSPLVDDHGRECMNAQLTLLILALVPCIGWLALVAWLPVSLVSLVRGAVAAASCEIFRYPALIRAIR